MSAPRPDVVIDAGEAFCHELLMMVFDQMKTLTPGAVMEVIGYEPSGVIDLEAWSRQTGHPILFVDYVRGKRPFRLYIQKRPAEGDEHSVSG